jgi:type II secretory pathway component PulF
MLESLFPSFAHWLRFAAPRWRLSTWWLSDTLDAMQQSLLRILAVAHRERLELAPLVANLAEEHRGRYRRRLRRLAGRLKEGTSLVDALEQTPDALKDEDVLALRFATQTGTLGPTYQAFLEDATVNDGQASTIHGQTLIYALVSLVVLGLVLSFLVTFIVPTLKWMQEEFDVSDPHPLFHAFLAGLDWVMRHAPLMILAVMTLGVLVWSAPSRRFFRRRFAGHWIRGVAQARSSQLLRLLSTTEEAGRPVPSAISSLARYHFDRSVRQKLLYARNEIEQGSDVWTSLADAKLLTPEESNAIAHSSSHETRAWVMRELADWKRQQVANRTGSRMRLVQPLVTLVFAAVVLLTGGAMIGFLAQLAQSLATII